VIKKTFKDILEGTIRSFQWLDQLMNSSRVSECDSLDDESDAISNILIQSTQITEPLFAVALAFRNVDEVLWNRQTRVAD
jgi:hypothetical protein